MAVVTMTDLIDLGLIGVCAGLAGCGLFYLMNPSRFEDSHRKYACWAVGLFAVFQFGSFYITKGELVEAKAASRATVAAHEQEVGRLAAIIERKPKFRAPTPEEGADIWNAVINTRKAAFTDGRMRRGTKGEGRGARRIDDGLQRVSRGTGG